MRPSPRKVAPSLAVLVAVFACGDIQAPDAEFEPTLSAARGGAGPADASGVFVTHLTGAEEVGPVDTRAQGQAMFRLSRDGSSLSYRLMAANIENVLMAHIHKGPAGENGGVVVWLYPDGPPPQLIPGRFGGVLATGTITADDLVGDLDDQALSALVDLLRTDGAYVNVHTSAHPGGEIRGQID